MYGQSCRVGACVMLWVLLVLGCTLDEVVVVMGVAGTVELLLALGEVIKTLDGTF